MDSRSGMLVEKLPRPEVEELVLEEVPDVSYDDVGGLDDQIEMIKDAVELPYLYGDLFREHDLQAPKGILLYGPPGCGKTLIAKAVANSLAKRVAEKTGNVSAKSYFLNIKGPELLNKYVGETERQIRLIFQRAREKSEEGNPVIVFFDENKFLEVTYQNGDKETLYFKDFSSGAMIENIVRRAKKLSIKRTIAGGDRGIEVQDLLDSIKQEFREHEDLPNTTNPDDWAKISGKKGERIVYVRTIVNEGDDAQGGRQIERVTTGQYL